MKNSENKKFEENWRNAFSDVEATPSDNVWTNIDMHLSRVESGTMKQRVVFYQRLAAASVIFAIGLTGLGFWYSTRNKQEQLTEVRKEENSMGRETPAREGSNGKDRRANTGTSATEGSGNSENHRYPDDVRKNNQRVQLNKNKNEGKADQKLTLHPVVSHSAKAEIAGATYDSIPPILLTENANDESVKKNSEVSLNESPQEESKEKSEPVKEEFPAVLTLLEPVVAQNESKQKGNADEDWWASLGGTTGSYNPNGGTASPPVYSNTSGNSAYTTPQSNSSRVGTSFSFGMNFGKKIAPRWMVMSGFNYLTQSTEYNSNVAKLSTNNSYSFAADALSQSSATAPTTPTTPYTLSSVNEFVSIPFQAGYLFIDRKVGLQLNAGIASDFFMKNTLTDQSGKLLKYTQGPGDHTLYRPVNLTGLMGTELSYKVAKHYRVSVVPGLRYSFNSVLKSTAGTTLNPIVWDVGFRFRYMF